MSEAVPEEEVLPREQVHREVGLSHNQVNLEESPNASMYKVRTIYQQHSTGYKYKIVTSPPRLLTQCVTGYLSQYYCYTGQGLLQFIYLLQIICNTHDQMGQQWAMQDGMGLPDHFPSIYLFTLPVTSSALDSKMYQVWPIGQLKFHALWWSKFAATFPPAGSSRFFCRFLITFF